jgi:transposase InsO family protein
MSYAQNVSNTDETLLWHSRFGHLPFRSLSLLQEHSMVKGLPVLNEQDSTCETYILGKHKRDSFPTASHRAKKDLELVQKDLRGPMQTQSIGERFYFLTFIDDFSRKIWIYFTKNKSETFSRFKDFKVEAIKQSDKFVKMLRLDGGGKYNSKYFADFCRQHGIIMQTTTKYTPQQNGVAERKNQTIMNMAKSMLKQRICPMTIGLKLLLVQFTS